ncbi:hypothetical protein [uncultured Rhodoblastus sp.]|uniref:hypothetical protein n=1 Tax=uncultured Rhodoblastus sp. TaxID=543037 RepID=UPI0025FF62D3|nr:hypothetical protein [uncultured Rhodoblastus sp.]
MLAPHDAEAALTGWPSPNPFWLQYFKYHVTKTAAFYSKKGKGGIFYREIINPIRQLTGAYILRNRYWSKLEQVAARGDRPGKVALQPRSFPSRDARGSAAVLIAQRTRHFAMRQIKSIFTIS